MEIIPNLFSGEWHFRNRRSYLSEISVDAVNTLTSEQQSTSLIEATFANVKNEIACSRHTVKSNSPPIKQRHYLLQYFKNG